MDMLFITTEASRTIPFHRKRLTDRRLWVDTDVSVKAVFLGTVSLLKVNTVWHDVVVGCVGQAAGGFGAFALKESRTDRSTVTIVTKETSVSVGTATVTRVESAVGRFLLSCLIAFENK